MMDRPRYSGFIPGSHAIEAYGKGGFLFAGMSHLGSLLALPSGLHAWEPTRAEEVDPESLAVLFSEPKGSVELLLFGGGPHLAPLPKATRQALREAGIGVDLMATGTATATYNLLREEKRRVAAALIAAP